VRCRDAVGELIGQDVTIVRVRAVSPISIHQVEHSAGDRIERRFGIVLGDLGHPENSQHHGCTGGDAASGFTGQAIPPMRIKQVCQALNIENEDGTTDVRCCIESICDDDFSNAIGCLTGVIQQSLIAPG
jgi:hypothetical protein